MTWAEEHGLRPCTRTLAQVHVFARRQVKSGRGAEAVVTEQLACVCGEQANEAERTSFERVEKARRVERVLAEVQRERNPR